MAIGAPEDCATEAGWVVEGPGVVLEIWPEVGTFVTGCDLAAEVVGTTVGSSSSTVRSTTSAVLCRNGWITVDILFLLRCS